AYDTTAALAIVVATVPIFNLSNAVGGSGGRRPRAEGGERFTGRGSVDDRDTPQNRPPSELPEEPKSEVWEATPLSPEQLRNGIYVIPPSARPRVVFRYAAAPPFPPSALPQPANHLPHPPPA